MIMSSLCLQAAEARLFQLETGQAATTLKLFAQQARLSIVFDPRSVEDVQTCPVRGELMPCEALSLMLTHTPLVFNQDVKTGAFAVTRAETMSGAEASPKSPATTTVVNPTENTTTPATPAMKEEKPRSRSFLKSLLALALTGASASAQTPTTTPTTTPSEGEEIVVLSPFVVDASKDSGYRAENTLNGSRLNTSLKDVASNISVFTEEFIQDIAANSLEELVAYDANTQRDEFDTQGATNSNAFNSATPNSRNSFNSRGLGGGFSQDFDRTFAPGDTYNISRADFSKGPNSVLFGLGGIGGVINATTNRPKYTTNTVGVEVQAGSWQLLRGVLNINRVLIRQKLALSVDLLDHSQNGYQYFSFKDSRRGTVSVGYMPFSRLEIRAKYEKGYDHRSNQRPFGPQDNVSEWAENGKGIPVLGTNNIAVAQPLAGIGVNGANTYLVFTDGALTNRARSATTTAFNDPNNPNIAGIRNINYNRRRLYDDPSLGELSISNRVGVSGPDCIAENDFDSLKVSMEGRLTDNIVMEASYFRETIDTYGQNTNAPPLEADPNDFIGGIQTGTGATSPFAPANRLGNNTRVGQYFFEDSWRKQEDVSKQDTLQASLAGLFDFAKFAPKNRLLNKLGRHRLTGIFQHNTQEEKRAELFEVLSWNDLNSGLITGLNTAEPENGRNRITHRNYVTLGDWKHFTVSRFPTSNVYPLPQLGAGRTMTTAWVPRTANSVADDRVTRDVLMTAVQSYFWNGRIVTIVGYRKDSFKVDESQVRRDTAATNPGGVTDFDQDGMQNEWVVFRNEPGVITKRSGTTRNQGIVFHATNNLDLFFNHSNGLDQPKLRDRVAPNGEVAPGTRGDTNDFGVRFSILDNRISGGVTFFDTIEKNRFFSDRGSVPNAVAYGLDVLKLVKDASGNFLISQQEADTLRPTFTGGLGDATSHGYELALTGDITKNLTVRLTYTETKATITNVLRDHEAYLDERLALLEERLSTIGANTKMVFTPDGQKLTDPPLLPGGNAADNLLTIDQRVGEARNDLILLKADKEYGYGQQPKKLSATARYQFAEGRLKGLALGTTVRWASAKPIARDIDYTDLNRNYIIDDGELPIGSDGLYVVNTTQVIRGQEDLSVDGFITYRFKAPFAKGLKSSIQLNVYNILNEHDILVSRLNEARTGPAQFRWRDPRSFRVTFRTEF